MSSSSYYRLQGVFSKSPKHIPASAASAASAAASVMPTASTTMEEAPQKIRKLVRRFKSASQKIEFRRRQDPFDRAVATLAAGKHFSAIESILEHQKKYKDSMSEEEFLIKLISLYGKSGMFNHAYKLFDEMPKYGSPRTVFTFNALLSACVRCNKIDKLSEFFRELPEKLGIQPNLFSYNIALNGFCASNDFDSAMKLLENMEDSPIGTDIVSYNTIFEGYYKENKVEEAGKLWQRMEEKGVVANVRTYNARLRGLIHNDQVQEAFELVEKMVNQEVKPDTHSYNIVITGCVVSGKLKEAKILHSKMVGDVCLPDHRTFGMLIPFACDKGDVDFALELTKQAYELNVNVDKQLIHLVVDALTKRSMIKEAKELVALVNSSKKHQHNSST